jgi:hypothetical protein
MTKPDRLPSSRAKEHRVRLHKGCQPAYVDRTHRLGRLKANCRHRNSRALAQLELIPAQQGCACRKPIGWRLTEKRAMLIRNERYCQAHCVGGCRSVSVAGSDRGSRSLFCDEPPPGGNPSVPSTGWCSLVFIASSLAFLMRLRLLGPRPSSNGTVRASVCTGAGSRDRAAGHQFRWKYAD